MITKPVIRSVVRGIVEGVGAGLVSSYSYFWPLTSSLSEYSGMTGTILRDSAASYVAADTSFVTYADGDETPFSHASIEDETGYTDIQGSFVDASAWFDAGLNGSDSLADQADTGNLLIIDDTAAKGHGYIGEVGTGEVITALANNVTGITKADPGVVSSVAHGLSVGSLVYFDSLTEMTELNNTYKVVTAVGSADLFSINDTSGYVAAETTGGACAHEITEPATTAVKIYKDYELLTPGWNALDTGLDYNSITAFDVYQNLMFEYPDLVTNGDGSSTTGWDSSSGGVITSTGGRIRCAMPVGDGYGKAGQALTTVIGKQYNFNFNYFSGTMADGSMSYRIGTTVAGADVKASAPLTGDGLIDSSYTPVLTFTAITTTTYFYFAPHADNTAGNYFEVDNFHVRQNIPGAEARFEANGLLSEGEGTNWCLQSNDMTEAVWTAVNITPALDVEGVDGVASSASRLTATANDGTIKQSINTLASADNAYSVWLKRITGTGAIYLTDDDGANWTEKTLTTTWTRFFVTRSQTDPIVGIKMAIDTDVIAAQFNQVEAGQAYISSAIPTTTIPVTRTADSHSWVMSTEFKNLMGDVADSPFTMVCEWTPKFDYGDTGGSESILRVSTSTRELFYIDQTGGFNSWEGSSTSTVGPGYTANTTYLFALRVYDDAGTMMFEVGEKHGDVWTWDATPATYDGSFNPATDLLIGYLNQYPFNVKNITFYDSAKDQSWIEGKY